MTSTERVMTALSRKEPDRVPVFELGIDPRMVGKLGYRSVVELFEEMDLDAVIVGLLVSSPEGTPLEVPRASRYVDDWGVTLQYTDESVAIPVDHPIKSPADVESWAAPPPSFPVEYMRKVDAVVRRYKGKRALLSHSRAVFAHSWNLLGMENYMVALIENPNLVERLTRKIITVNEGRARQLAEAGLDIVYLGDDYAFKTAPLISPDHFRRFVLPGLSRVVGAIHEAGALCIKHTDGDIWSLMDMIVGTGVDCLGPLEPGANMDLRRVKSGYGDRIAVMGNVDIDLLSRGTPEQVAEATLGLLHGVSPGGGHVVSSANTISRSVRAENFRAMVETAQRHGTYPIVK